MNDWDKKFRRNLNDIKRGIKNLRKMNLKIEIHPTETMYGTIVDHIYVIDRMGERICLQKHLFTVEPSITN